jgi:hypothetical protein
MGVDYGFGYRTEKCETEKSAAAVADFRAKESRKMSGRKK